MACGWYGINAWIGGGMLHDLTRLWAPPAYARWEGGETFMFFIFGAVNVAVVIWGMEGIRRVLVVQVREPTSIVPCHVCEWKPHGRTHTDPICTEKRAPSWCSSPS